MSPELKYFGGNSHCQRPECREEEGALLPRAVFAQSRNTRLLASGMCSERAAFINCLAPKQTDRYHRTKACRATCLHPRYEVHHPAKTFASGVKLDQVTRYPRVKLDQVTRYPLSPPILACGATLSCWLPLSRASKSFLFRRRVSAGQAGNVVTTNAQVTRLTLPSSGEKCFGATAS